MHAEDKHARLVRQLVTIREYYLECDCVRGVSRMMSSRKSKL
jgi:hypothetical protein